MIRTGTVVPGGAGHGPRTATTRMRPAAGWPEPGTGRPYETSGEARRQPAVGPAPSTSTAWARWGATVLVLAVATVTLVRQALSPYYLVWPDEIYQTVEQAHRVVAGYGMIPWEFTAGTRSWIGPGLMLPPVWLSQRLGVRSGAVLLTETRLWLALLALLTVAGTSALATRLHSRTAGALAGLAVAVAPVPGLYLTHALADTLVLPFVVWSFVAVLSDAAAAVAAGGAAMAVVVYLRPQTVVLAAGLLLLAVARGRRTTAVAAAGAAAALAACAWLDRATLGVPFASVLRSVDFNLVRGGAEVFGTQPWSFYAVRITRLLSTWGTVAVLTGVLAALLGAVRRPGAMRLLAVAALGQLVLLSLIGHKEVRFALPAAPVLLVVAACGLVGAGGGLVRAARRRAGRPAAAVRVAGRAAIWLTAAAVALGLTAWATTDPASASTPDGVLAAQVDTALSAAGTDPATCGIALVGPRLVWTGALTAVDRDVPLVAVAPDRARRHGIPRYLNTVVDSAGGTLRGRWAATMTTGHVVVEVRPGGCAAPPPSYTVRLRPPAGAPPA